MIRVKSLILAVVATICFTTLVAQSLDDYRAKLSIVERNDELGVSHYANAEVNEELSAVAAFKALASQNTGSDGKAIEPSKQGYRIGIFFDNSAKARAAANEVVERCNSQFADIPVTLTYDNPYFKVSAGYCLELEEAVMMLHRVQKVFPRAYLMHETITPADLIKSRDAEIEAQRRDAEIADAEVVTDQAE